MKPNNPKSLTNKALVEYGRKIAEKSTRKGPSCSDFAWIDDRLAELQDMWIAKKVGFDWDDMHELFREIAKHFYELGYETRR